MKLCKDCKNRGKKKNCQFYSSTSNYAEKCKDFTEIKPTNADRIRSMSDEELYSLIEKIKMCGGLIRTETTSSECRGCKDGFCCNVLQWLKSEVEG